MKACIGDVAVCYNLPGITEQLAHFVLLISILFHRLLSLPRLKLVVEG